MIERYVYAVTKYMKADLKKDVSAELETIIQDMLEERCGGSSLDDCKYAVIKIKGLSHRQYGFHPLIHVDSVLYSFLPSISVANDTRKQIIDRLYKITGDNEMKCLFLISLVALCGCETSPMDKARQDFVCKDSGGVYEYAPKLAKTLCNDGVYKEWTGAVITKDFYPKKEIKQ